MSKDFHFCDNPECERHQLVPPRTRELSIVKEDGYLKYKTSVYRNHLFYSPDGEYLRFCNTCAAAVKLTLVTYN